jgi:DNA adenine methylase
MKPFLKWAGGKRWLTKQLAVHLPETFNRYFEPFLGSAAVYFELTPARAILSDANEALIATYCAIRDHPEEIHESLSRLHMRHNSALYYEQRALRTDDPIKAATRFIYLNRTCWNGLYRVNQKNEFNVPIGTKSTVLFPDDDFNLIAEALAKAEIRAGDFEISIDRAQCGDLIYVDPPYTVKHNFNGFLKYNQVMFSWDDQVRLHDCLVRARERGCHIVISNADHHSIRELYSDFDDMNSLSRASIIAGKSSARSSTTELLVVHNG